MRTGRYDLHGCVIKSCFDPSHSSIRKHQTNSCHPFAIEVGTSNVPEELHETHTCQWSNFWAVIEVSKPFEGCIVEDISRLLSKDVLQSTLSGANDCDRARIELFGDSVVCGE